MEVPDGMVDGVYELETPTPTASDAELVEASLDNPLGSENLAALVRPGMKIAVAVDDASRSTRTDLMLPAVLDRLACARIPNQDVTVVVALGTHRRMTDDELREKLGARAVNEYRIVSPDWHDPSGYVSVGRSRYGFDTRVHRAVVEADVVVGLGQTIPHMIAGFGGGCKIIVPGCSDAETIGHMHWMCSRVADGELFAVRDNAVREVIDETALKAGLRFIVNEVPGAAGRLAAVFAGDPVAAHRRACEAAADACRVVVRRRSDIVLADAYPSDVEFWQALKGLNAARGAVKRGGTVILVTPCPEGVSSQHHEVTSVGYVETERIRDMVARGKLDRAVAANLLLGRRLLDRADAVLVTKGITREQTLAMNMQWAPSPQAALDRAIAKHGSGARINVLYKAAKMVIAPQSGFGD